MEKSPAQLITWVRLGIYVRSDPNIILNHSKCDSMTKKNACQNDFLKRREELKCDFSSSCHRYTPQSCHCRPYSMAATTITLTVIEMFMQLILHCQLYCNYVYHRWLTIVSILVSGMITRVNFSRFTNTCLSSYFNDNFCKFY